MVLSDDHTAEEEPEWSGELIVRTMGGTEHVIRDLRPAALVAAVLQRLGEVLGTTPASLVLLLGVQELQPSQTLLEVGLAHEGAAVAVMRKAVTKEMLEGLCNELVLAIRGRRFQEAKRLVDLGAGFDIDGSLWRARDLGYGTNDNVSMLNLAIRERLEDLALYVIARGTDVEVHGSGNRRPLIQAVLARFDRVAEALLDAGADASVRDYNNTSALEYALRQHSDRISARLIAPLPLQDQEKAFVGVAPCLDGLEIAGCLRRPCPGAYRWRPLLLCCASGMPMAAAELLKARAEINGRDQQGRTALHYAHARGLTELVSELVAAGADEAAQDDAGWLPHDGVRAHTDFTSCFRDAPKEVKPRRCLLSLLY